MKRVVGNKLVRNEQRKLTATYFNGIAIALMAVGFFGPLINFAQTGASSIGTTLVLVICIMASVVLHLQALRVLRGMEE